MAGIYIHIPFCKQACYYCDFHFSTNQQYRSELLNAIETELRLQQTYLTNQPIDTIYFGGGTPSLLTAEEINSILEVIRHNFNASTVTEITLEANPDDLTPEHLTQLAAVGVNRLSIGIQSFDNTLLKFLHRAHDAETATDCILFARQAGFKNISMDLIYAIPGQSDAMWINDLQHAIALEADHLSCYSLTIEEKTVFGKWSNTGKFKPTDDATAARHLEMVMDQLQEAGYEHYEISNFAKPGFQSRHNSNYWKQQFYLGVGPSAHSFNGHSRQFNISNNSLYVKAISQGNIPFEKEVLTQADQINEYILTTLRTQWGTDLKKLQTNHAYDLQKEHATYLMSLLEKELAILNGDILLLTKKGKLFADKISSDLFILSI